MDLRVALVERADGEIVCSDQSDAVFDKPTCRILVDSHVVFEKLRLVKFSCVAIATEQQTTAGAVRKVFDEELLSDWTFLGIVQDDAWADQIPQVEARDQAAPWNKVAGGIQMGCRMRPEVEMGQLDPVTRLVAFVDA